MTKLRHLAVLTLTLATILVSWSPGRTSEAAPPQPPLYQVTLPAAGREERTSLAASGIVIDAVGPGTVTTIVDAAGLAELRAAGLRPIAVTPLDFPPADSAYHNYAEMLAAIEKAAAARPDIVHITTAALSLEGRPILAVKISDEPRVDDPAEPGVLFFALTHAREHLTVEMALAIIRLFTDKYGVDPEITNLVNTRELWVLPNVNPDGGEYDIAGDSYRFWRKNRRPNPDGTYGVDLNRNYAYRWGCCNGSSPIPGSETYRGPSAFSEPETRAVRDFVLAHPDITAAVSFHTYGELILYPYGYTYEDLPPDMDEEDYRTFVALADRMAQTNGYTPQQSSDLYITAGDAVDWLYGDRRIFAFTFEMYPRSPSPGFYPPGGVIGEETARNFAAVSYLAAVADNPRKIIGLGGDISPPTVRLQITASSPVMMGNPVTLTATATDDVAVSLLAWQVDDKTVALSRGNAGVATWIPDAPGLHSVQALAFDAGGNRGASDPIPVAVHRPVQATLGLPDPAVLSVDAPLNLGFTHPITGNTIRLRFDPPVGYVILSANGAKAQVLHAPFRRATAYTLTLEGGQGPFAVLEPARWTFTTEPWRIFAPLVGGW